MEPIRAAFSPLIEAQPLSSEANVLSPMIMLLAESNSTTPHRIASPRELARESGPAFCSERRAVVHCIVFELARVERLLRRQDAQRLHDLTALRVERIVCDRENLGEQQRRTDVTAERFLEHIGA